MCEVVFRPCHPGDLVGQTLSSVNLEISAIVPLLFKHPSEGGFMKRLRLAKFVERIERLAQAVEYPILTHRPG